jgi:CheY-like chemotaxis protein
MAHATPELNLLIVDDEVATLSLLRQIFTQRGFNVRTAEDGFAALRIIRDRVPDVLLSDLNMPGMSGFELLSVVRRLYPAIHVIASSGAYSGTSVPHGSAADGFHEKASGIAHLFDLMATGSLRDHTAALAGRTQTPLWVDLELRLPFESNYVLINCPQCLRAFRQPIDEVNPHLREATCRHCNGAVAYALAMAIKPPNMPGAPQTTKAPRPNHTA